MVHIGKEILNRAKEKRIGPSELARRINKSRQNVNHIFHRKSLDTDLLQIISKALEFDFFRLYNFTDHKEDKEKVLIVQQEQIHHLTQQNKVLTQALSEEQGNRKNLRAKEKLIEELKLTIERQKAEIVKLKKKGGLK